MSGNWEIVVGLETHAQLATVSKMFSGASTAFGAPPNEQACAVDIALPGVLPVANRAAVAHAIRFGLAVGGTINRRSVFERKHYFYPDLPKAYQISQYQRPIVEGGSLVIGTAAGEKTVRLTRAHLEEDAGKSLHEDFHGATGIDLNRAGTPLLEIVSEPDLRSAEEAVVYAKTLHSLVRWIGICDGNMQEGSFRCDANVSVRHPGEPLGTRCEIKNLNSFRFLEQAIRYEVRRQIDVLSGGGRVVQETRLYDPDRGETRAMRSKEDAHDYRYFPDPDLPPLALTEQWIDEIAAALPELPQAKRARYQTSLALSAYDAAGLTQSADVAVYFEQVLAALQSADRAADAKLAANWITGELASALNRSDGDVEQSRVSSSALAGLLKRIRDNTISGKIAKELFDAMWAGEAHGAGAADELIEKRGLRQITDSAALEAVVEAIIAANPAQVAEFKAGRDKAFNFLVGQAMKATKGKGNPSAINELLKKKLAALA
jgi:aspartyl-tRNA(Asn)/glutamyl-tRNA(Gln) amidotransferase subunit B